MKTISILPKDKYYEKEFITIIPVSENVMLKRVYNEIAQHIYYFIVVNKKEILISNSNFHLIKSTIDKPQFIEEVKYKYFTKNNKDAYILETWSGNLATLEEFYDSFTWE